MNFDNKVVIVTGAGGDMGRAIVKKFSSLGALTVQMDVKEELARKTAEEVGLSPERSMVMAADVSDEQCVKDSIAAILERFGRIDCLVNLAGISGPSARVEDYTFAATKRVFEVNVYGTFLMTQNVLPTMQKQKSGAIVSFGSVSGMTGYPYEISYGASKAAIINMMKTVANENGANGVSANTISPGWVNTGMMKSILASYKDVGIENSADNVTLGPMQRPGEPEEMANVVCFLCSEESSYMNGSNVLVDGGMMLG